MSQADADKTKRIHHVARGCIDLSVSTRRGTTLYHVMLWGFFCGCVFQTPSLIGRGLEKLLHS
jgi:hypothetical protein